MRQSRKEQGLERASRILLNPDRREARMLAELGTDMEAAEEWEGRQSFVGRTGFDR
ncbi:hypothetical protein [Paenibacillus soyae]|uniref:Uncharacterized protein n=1 Tax=Paenibacillus soyae TaxID=2969249 RepID=A0A9X2MMX0_9BACL|nr:hypothetical protein [Paenibacillus soyae]MCR2802668.1 hypothetical protein [Paenibacillus soyae]